jgi:flagellar basal body-associated protein FliL
MTEGVKVPDEKSPTALIVVAVVLMVALSCIFALLMYKEQKAQQKSDGGRTAKTGVAKAEQTKRS